MTERKERNIGYQMNQSWSQHPSNVRHVQENCSIRIAIFRGIPNRFEHVMMISNFYQKQNLSKAKLVTLDTNDWLMIFLTQHNKHLWSHHKTRDIKINIFIHPHFRTIQNWTILASVLNLLVRECVPVYCHIQHMHLSLIRRSCEMIDQ